MNKPGLFIFTDKNVNEQSKTDVRGGKPKPVIQQQATISMNPAILTLLMHFNIVDQKILLMNP
jgi:hypothetical protein